MAINSRKKGHGFELEIVKRFKEVGFDEAMTTRLGSKLLDDQKIDIMNVGRFNPQCKAVEKMNPHAVFSEIPSGDGKMALLFHKKNRQGTLVSMSLDDFFRILKALREAGMIDSDLW